MAGVRVELLAVLAGALLLVSVRGWKRIDEPRLLSFYKNGRWGKPQGAASLDDHSAFDGDDAVPEVEAAATSDHLDPSADHGFQVDPLNSARNWESITKGFQSKFDSPTTSDLDSGSDSGSEVEFDDPTPPNWASSTDGSFELDFDDATLTNWASGPDSGSQIDFDDDVPPNWASGTDSSELDFDDAKLTNWASGTDIDSQAEVVADLPRSWSSGTSQSSAGLDVVCSLDGFQITLPKGPLNKVKVLGSNYLSVMDVPESCGYEVNSLKNTLTVPFTGCNVNHTDGYSLQLLYVDEFGQTQVATASCEERLDFQSGSLHSSCQPEPKYGKMSPPGQTLQTLQALQSLPLGPPEAHNCAVSPEERLTCGYLGISSCDCKKMGCCVDSSTHACFYPLDECTMDQHFVFTIRDNSASIPVDPTKLVIPGTNCRPLLANNRVAIYKFKVTECGTRSYQIGETRVYLAEVQTVVKALNLKYGFITRSHPVRFLIECRYSQSGTAQSALASTGFLVKTPSSSLPSSVLTSGLYGVQLRIARDQTYTSYLSTYHQPLRLLLGRPVYLELILASSEAVILVNYCIAYPRSASNALVLIYEGCANPYDPNVKILNVNNLPQKPNRRRFMVDAFQFMDQKTNKYLNEEIYFMCSTEVCWPTEKICQDRCLS